MGRAMPRRRRVTLDPRQAAPAQSRSAMYTLRNAVSAMTAHDYRMLVSRIADDIWNRDDLEFWRRAIAMYRGAFRDAHVTHEGADR